MRHGLKALAMSGALVALVAAGCSSSSKSSTGTTVSPATTAGGGAGNTASAPGVTPTTIKIGFITSVTGNASSTFFDAADGAKAYFDAINAAGGVDGRKIEVVTDDDPPPRRATWPPPSSCSARTSTPSSASAPTTSAATRPAVDIPTTGGGFDGPEWATAPNMFTTTGDTNGRTSNNTQIANFFKIVGATNVGGLAYGISPSSTGSIEDTKTALQMIGLKMGYENLSVPFGGVDVTAYILAMKQAGVDGAACSCVQSTNLALFTVLRQAGHDQRQGAVVLVRRQQRVLQRHGCGRRPGCLLPVADPAARPEQLGHQHDDRQPEAVRPAVPRGATRASERRAPTWRRS